MEAKGGRELLLRMNNLEQSFVPKSNQSLELLPFVVKFMAKNGIGVNELTEIEVQTNVASFTTARQIVTLANMFHWLYGTKIIKEEDVGTEYLVPTYYAPPKITISKKSLV